MLLWLKMEENQRFVIFGPEKGGLMQNKDFTRGLPRKLTPLWYGMRMGPKLGGGDTCGLH